MAGIFDKLNKAKLGIYSSLPFQRLKIFERVSSCNEKFKKGLGVKRKDLLKHITINSVIVFVLLFNCAKIKINFDTTDIIEIQINDRKLHFKYISKNTLFSNTSNTFDIYGNNENTTRMFKLELKDYDGIKEISYIKRLHDAIIHDVVFSKIKAHIPILLYVVGLYALIQSVIDM